MEQCVRQRRALPERIQNAPQLQTGLALFYMAFMDLTTERQVGEAIGAIPWTAVDRYCEANELYGEQREDMFYHIGRLDRAYIEWFFAKQKKEMESLKARSGKTTTKKR